MDKAKPLSEKIIEQTNKLPDCCQSFLNNIIAKTAPTTRLAYARELSWFFDYLISYSPIFCDKNKKELTIADMKLIVPDDISRYLAIYINQQKAERTVARKRAALSSFFKYLTGNRYIDYNPVLAASSVKIHTSDDVIHIDIEDQLKLLKMTNSGDCLNEKQASYHERYKKRDYALLLLLLDTGIRVSELNQINISDLDYDKCSVLITRKGGNIQHVYFSDETRDAIYEYINERRIKEPNLSEFEPLFVTLKGDRLCVRAIENLVKKYTSSALPGIGVHLSPHKMRASFAMAFYREEKDILMLQKKLGHKNLAATNIYAKATENEMAESRSVLAKKREEINSDN